MLGSGCVACYLMCANCSTLNLYTTSISVYQSARKAVRAYLWCHKVLTNLEHITKKRMPFIRLQKTVLRICKAYLTGTERDGRDLRLREEFSGSNTSFEQKGLFTSDGLIVMLEGRYYSTLYLVSSLWSALINCATRPVGQATITRVHYVYSNAFRSSRWYYHGDLVDHACKGYLWQHLKQFKQLLKAFVNQPCETVQYALKVHVLTLWTQSDSVACKFWGHRHLRGLLCTQKEHKGKHLKGRARVGWKLALSWIPGGRRVWEGLTASIIWNFLRS